MIFYSFLLKKLVASILQKHWCNRPAFSIFVLLKK